MFPNKRKRADSLESFSSNAEVAMGERRGICPSLGCSRSVAFRKERRHLIILSVLAGVVFFGCGLLGGTMSRHSAPAPNAGSLSSTSKTPVGTEQQQLTSIVGSGETQEIKVRLFNAYTESNPISLYPWEHMAEPYKPTTMEVQDWPQSGENLEYRWDVDGHLQGYGRAVGVLFTAIGTYNCSVVAFDPTLTGQDPSLRGGSTGNEESARVAGPYVFSVQVKYVRREIRSLTDQDREMFFNAVSVLQRVPSGVGQAVYGSQYYSKDYFNRLHLYYGGTKDCDHWHQGAGFVTSHMGLTLMYEQALQAVNPAVSMPYWDFTLESTFFGASDFRTSGVFADDWFGEAAPDNDLKTPTKGRFAYVPAMTDAKDFSNLYNSYGLLRSSWNNDPTPFMTRHNYVYGFFNNLKPSGCFEYSHSLTNNNWMSLSKVLNAAAHGHIHETIGGSWNHYFGKEAKGLDKTHDDEVMTFAHEIQALSKDLWRVDFLQCPASCSFEQPWHDCQCQCDAGAIGNRSAAQVLKDSGVLDSVTYYDSDGEYVEAFEDENGDVYYIIPGYNKEESDKIYERMLYILCSPGHIGSMFQATSTNDITFWVLHPTVDRLWHLKGLGAKDFDETWDPYHTCVGHNPDDLQPFHDMFPSWDADHSDVAKVVGPRANTVVLPRKKYYTNTEMYDLLQPDETDLPYVYDNFAWPHCSVLGDDMVA